MAVEAIDASARERVKASGAPIIDCDQHYYETADCLTRHMDPNVARHNFRWLESSGGGRRLIVKDRMLRMIIDPTFDQVAMPGSQLQMFKEGKGNDYAAAGQNVEPIRESYRNRDARIAVLEEQGVDSAWLFPTLGVVIESLIADDVPLTVETFRSFNRWVSEEWGFAYRDRLFGAAYITLADRDAAITELEWLMRNGCRIINVRSSPLQVVGGGRSPADPHYDPFWARVQEAGIVVAAHGGDSGGFAQAARWGEQRNPPTHLLTNFAYATHGFRDVFELIGSMVLHGLFERFPRLKVISVEQGSDWVPFLLQRLKHVRNRRDMYQLKGDPVEYFRNNVSISPFAEDDIVHLVQTIGADRVVFGSDFPHPEGTDEPIAFVDEIEALSTDDLRKIMGGNAAALLAAA